MPFRVRALVPIVLALGLAACGGGGSPSNPTTPSGRPSSPARLELLSPHNGQVVHGTSVRVRLRLRGARIVPTASTHIRPTTGHIHLLLDGRVVSMNYGTSEVLRGLKPGTHSLRVEFVAADHFPFDPRVFTDVAFQVKP